MKIKVHSKLLYLGREFWLVGGEPKIAADRPQHDRYLVVPGKPYTTEIHSYIRFIDVPKLKYAVMGTEEIILDVVENNTIVPMGEPEFPDWIIDPHTNEVISEE